MQATEVATRGSRLLVGAVVVMAGLLATTLIIAMIVRSPSHETATIPLSGIARGASLHHLDNRGVVLVRDGDDVRAFSAWDGRGDALVLCADAGVFSTSVYASRYALDGTKLAGPGPGPLEEYATHVEGDHLVVTLSHRFDHPVPRWSDAMPSVFANPSVTYCPPA